MNYCDTGGILCVCTASVGEQPDCGGFAPHSHRNGCTWFNGDLNNHCGNPQARIGFPDRRGEMLDAVFDEEMDEDTSVLDLNEMFSSCDSCRNATGCAGYNALINDSLDSRGEDPTEQELIDMAQDCPFYEYKADQFDF